jgi:hypothetical protein
MRAIRPSERDPIRLTPSTDTWWAERSTAARLLRAGQPDWFELGSDPRAALIKQNALRRVHRVSLSEGIFYVKRYQYSGPAARLKEWLKADPAHRELRAADYARDHGVPAVAFAALARRSAGRQGSIWLSISPELPNRGNLIECFLAACEEPDWRERRRLGDALLAAAAQLIAAAHSARFLHADNHPGNILVCAGPDGSWQCAYADVSSARCGRRISDAETVANLAAVHQWFRDRAGAVQRLRALKRYSAARCGRADRRDLKALARRILEASRRHGFRLYRKRDGRIGRDRNHYARIDVAGGWRAVVTLQFRHLREQMALDSLPRDRKQFLAEARARIQECARTRLAPTGDHNGDHGPWLSAWWRQWCSGRGHSPAQRRYHAACLAMNRDVPCAPPVALLVRKARPGQWSWIRFVPAGSVPLLDWLRTEAGIAARRQVFAAAGQLLARSFDRGLIPRAPACANLMVAGGPDGTPCVYWQDIEAEVQYSPLEAAQRIRVLSELACDLIRHRPGSLITQARILHSYIRYAQGPARDRDLKVLWRRIHTAVGDLAPGPAVPASNTGGEFTWSN